MQPNRYQDRFGDRFGRVALAAVFTMFAGCGENAAVTDETAQQQSAELAAQDALQPLTKSACEPTNQRGRMRCFARVVTNQEGIVELAAAPKGLGPADLRSAYKLPTSGGAGKIIAIVDAQDNPNAESDLAVYRAQYGLSPCTTANGCFMKVNQDGNASPLPTPDKGWAMEMALDLDTASAACPDCKLLLVEANNPTMEDLGAAVLTAVRLGAAVVSNSYGGLEDESIAATDAMYFNHPGVGIFVSSGDRGYETNYPASSQYVTAVGGTTLSKDSSARGWSEKVWGSWLSKILGGAGSGCSKFISKPTWQKDTGCSQRTVADVSAVADPASGLAVYSTYGGGGWMTVGGTSASSPIVAAIYALTGHAAADASLSYQKPSAFFDITRGNNGICTPGYLCTGGAAYDGPTGNGSPNGSAL